MEAEVVGFFDSMESAESARQTLVDKGVSTADVTIAAGESSLRFGDEEAHGLNLGSGVLPDAIPTIIEDHAGEGPANLAPARYVVRVRTHGDALNETIAREVLSTSTGYLA